MVRCRTVGAFDGTGTSTTGIFFVSQEKMLPIEEASFTNKKTSWDKFVFNRKTEARVAGYIKSYISKKYP
jgi:hypothetical protein